MISSRSLRDLHPKVSLLAQKMIAECHAARINLLVTSTYRDAEAQNELYARGRTGAGSIVTNAKAGQSFHNYRVAFDVVPIVGGKPVWSTDGDDGMLWKAVGMIGKSVGLEWAGDWERFKEYPHFQYTQGLSIADFSKGKTLK